MLFSIQVKYSCYFWAESMELLLTAVAGLRRGRGRGMISTRMSTRGRGPVESLGVGGGPFQPSTSLARPVALPAVATPPRSSPTRP